MLNIFPLDDTRVGLYVLDVTGHGVAASLASVAASHFLSPHSETSFVRNLGRSKNPSVASPSDVAEKLNHHFSSNPDYILLLTLVYGVLNVQTREFRYVCAGHPLPIVVSSSGSPRIIEGGGTPIGMARGFKCAEYSLTLEPGDRLYLYTDGVIEARNSKKDFLGRERFLNTLTETSGAPLADSLETIVSNTESWSKPQPPADDITVLACEIHG